MTPLPVNAKCQVDTNIKILFCHIQPHRSRLLGEPASLPLYDVCYSLSRSFSQPSTLQQTARRSSRVLDNVLGSFRGDAPASPRHLCRILEHLEHLHPAHRAPAPADAIQWADRLARKFRS